MGAYGCGAILLGALPVDRSHESQRVSGAQGKAKTRRSVRHVRVYSSPSNEGRTKVSASCPSFYSRAGITCY